MSPCLCEHGLALVEAQRLSCISDVVASDIATDHTLTSEQLREKYWANVSLAQKEWWGTDPQNLYKGFFDCSKAKRLLAWEHQ